MIGGDWRDERNLHQPTGSTGHAALFTYVVVRLVLPNNSCLMYFLAEDSYTRKLSTDVMGTVQHLHKLHCLAAVQSILQV